MITLSVRKIGNSLGVILPREALDALKVKEGDSITLTESPEGYRVTAYDSEFAKKMEKAAGIMGRYRNALRELAK
jgi:putative addiction module antidote